MNFQLIGKARNVLKMFFTSALFLFVIHTSSPSKAILAALGLKEALLDPGVSRMDPISPPDEESPFADLIAWQVYHLILKLGDVDGNSFVFG